MYSFPSLYGETVTSDYCGENQPLQGRQTPRLQILRIDRELRAGIIDDIITHGT